jgi:hypothetical protein
MKTSWLPAFALLLAVGCFYDSRWTQAPATQKNVAAKLTPRMELPGRPAEISRALRARVVVTASYQAGVPDWQRTFESTVADANATLTPATGAQLRIVGLTSWQGADGDDVEQLLAALESEDSAQDVDFVIALVGSTPRLENAFRRIGAARTPGKHLVLRAVSDAQEWQAIESSLASLSEDERREVHKARKRHKAAILLLHELGHALGAPHLRTAGAIMSRVYRQDAQRFSAATELLLKRAVDTLPPAASADAYYRALSSVLRGEHEKEWVASEREKVLAALDRAGSATSGAEPQVSAAAPPEVEGLTAAERRTFAESRRALAAGDAEAAHELGAKLFTEHTTSFEVQDLRCQVAMRRRQPFEQVERECAELKKLTPGLKHW